VASFDQVASSAKEIRAVPILYILDPSEAGSGVLCRRRSGCGESILIHSLSLAEADGFLFY
jgi:hypothetical protein